MKKVAILVSHPIQHFCPQYASFATKENVELKVFFASALGLKKYFDPNFRKEITWSNLYLDEFQHLFLNGEKVLPSNSKLDAKSLSIELTKYRPDVLVVYGYFQKLQRRAWRWAARNNTKLAYISDSELRSKRKNLLNWGKSLFLKFYFSKIDFFLTVGNANEEYYSAHGVPGRKMLRMHFPIDIRTYLSSYENRAELRQNVRLRFEIQQDSVVLAMVGKLVPWKNQNHIIDAMLLLEEKGVCCELFVIGSGEMMDGWRTLAMKLKKSRVHFTGFVNSQELPSYYAATDIYVHTAGVEPHSIAISEAIFMGCPVIISDRCGSYGHSDDVQEGKNGFVYRFGDIEQLAKKIEELSVNSELRKVFSDHSHIIARSFQMRSHHQVLADLVAEIE